LSSAPAALREIAEEVKRGHRDLRAFSIHFGGDAALSQEHGTSRVVPELGETRVSRDAGNFTRPIPDTQSLPETLWSQPSELDGD